MVRLLILKIKTCPCKKIFTISKNKLTMRQSIYRKIVLKLLGKMKLGKLHFTIMNNETHVFGEGDEVVADIRVNDESFFKRIVLYGDVGLGEAFMDKLWETSDITKVASWFILNISHLPDMSGSTGSPNPINLLKISNRILHALRPNSLKGARKNITAHYDLSNEFFSHFLDPTMTYSSALFPEENISLQQAQKQKYDSLCQSIKLSKEDHVFEIGCGWGGFAIHAAQNYGCKVTGITISEKQFKLATERVKAEQLEGQVDIVLEDYRRVKGKYDKVVSIEMIEAVGHKYFKQYFEKINELLKPQGVFGLQAIIIPDSRYDAYRKSIGWIQKHIFPGGLLPSVGKINQSVNLTSDLSLYSLKEMGNSYAQTLRNWYKNFQDNLSSVKELGFDETFIRKWEYYLCCCEASFLQRNINVVQMVYARPNNSSF